MKANPSSKLQHIPGRDGWPVFGETFLFLKNPFRWSSEAHDKHGRVVRTQMFFQASISVADPDFAERFFLDKDETFSSELGWWATLGRFFSNGLMLRDFDTHRLHRRIMQVAFKREALSGYMAIMQPILERGISGTATLAYPWVKQMTLDSAAAIFLGLDNEADTRRVNRLFTDIMLAAVAPFRLNVPGTAFARGIRSRAALRRWIIALIPARRASEGRDMLSILCRAITEDGHQFADTDIADHLVFLLMAAHDTTTSALTNLIMELGQRPEWQSRLRQQSRSIGPLTEEALPKLSLVYDCFREVLRLYPPVRTTPRRTLREIEIGGHRVPKNTQIWFNNERVQRDPSLWTHPDTFDPERFSDARAEHKRHRFAWIPFGAGAHTCLGLQFSELQVKMFMHLLLTRYAWNVDVSPMQYVPFIKPKNDLPIVLSAAS